LSRSAYITFRLKGNALWRVKQYCRRLTGVRPVCGESPIHSRS
jgi:hypothetical protein